jgi:hypothetical protein
MNENFENELRNALRPVEAPEGLADRIMSSLPPRTAAAPSVTPAPALEPVRVRKAPGRAPRRYWMPGALAASLLVAVLAGTHMAQLRDARIAREEGLAARSELLHALRLTSEKLDLAYQAVKATPDEGAIDEENRS